MYHILKKTTTLYSFLFQFICLVNKVRWKHILDVLLTDRTMLHGRGAIFTTNKMEAWFESKDNPFIFTPNTCNGWFRFHTLVFYKDKTTQIKVMSMEKINLKGNNFVFNL